jgi:hypothetical protein
MTDQLAATAFAEQGKVKPFGLGFGSAFPTLWPAAAILALAVLAQSLWETSADVSWLITLCEKILSGETPYVDFIESNPPAAIFIYMPGTWIARLLGASPELMVALISFVAIFASLSLSALILARAGLSQKIGPAGLALAVGAIALLPGHDFDQREHLGLVAGLPLLSAFIARASGAKVETSLAVLAGLGGALMASIKPHLALIILAALPYLAWRIGLRGLLTAIELYAAAFFTAIVVALTIVLFPAYLHKIVPLVATVYAPVRTPLIGLALNRGFQCWSALGLCLLLFGRGRIEDSVIAVPALGSLGAMAVFFIQAKSWPYHVYPAVALMTLGYGAFALETVAASWRKNTLVVLTIGAITLAFAFIYFYRAPRQDLAALERLVAQLAPRPKILVVGPDISLGFPLTRHVSGEWVNTPMGLWITASIQYLTRSNAPDEATRREYETYLRFDRETLVSDIENKKPDVVLTENDKWKDWAFAQADVAAALAEYAPVGAVGEVTVYGRKLGLRPSE